jgi:hypothetical protein
MAASEDVATFAGPGFRNITEIILAAITSPPADTEKKWVDNVVLMALRFFTNLFATPAGREAVSTAAHKVVELMEVVAGSTESLGQLSGPVGEGNRNVQLALTSLACNLASLAQPGASPDFDPDAVILLVANILGEVLKKQSDEEVLFRALEGLRRILTVSPDTASLVHGMGAQAAVEGAKRKAPGERVNRSADAVIRALQAARTD